jgi:hypothetical protein
MVADAMLPMLLPAAPVAAGRGADQPPGHVLGEANLPLPTCQTKRRLVLQFNKTSDVVFTSPAMSQVAAASLIDPVVGWGNLDT